MPVKRDAERPRPVPPELADAARKLAKALIRLAVERGTSIPEIKKSRCGRAWTGNAVMVGGRMSEKVYGPDWIVVRCVDGIEVNQAFRLADIYREIVGEIETARALEDFKLEPG